MRNKNLIRIASVCMAAAMALTPINASAATLLKKGSRGTEVKMVQTSLRELGYFTYPRVTGYYGSVTEKAVKQFQRDYGIRSDGVIGKLTRGALYGNKETIKKSGISILSISNASSEKMGALDWFSKVQYIFDRGDVAKITDVDTGRSFQVKRTFGTNHADVEPLTKEDTETIKKIWGGWKWTRRAVVVEIDGYVIAASLSAMPHAGVDSKPAVKYVSNRSGGYGYGKNLDAVKNNGVSGVLDLHFKNSRNHNTNRVKQAHQDMVRKAEQYIAKNYN